MTLGELIDALERAKPELSVVFDFPWVYPSGFGSYRGFFNELALGYVVGGYFGSNDYYKNVGELLASAKTADGMEYSGWKGGNFTMTRETPVWVANAGDTGTALRGVLIREHEVILVTFPRED